MLAYLVGKPYKEKNFSENKGLDLIFLTILSGVFDRFLITLFLITKAVSMTSSLERMCHELLNNMYNLKHLRLKASGQCGRYSNQDPEDHH